MTTLFSEQNTIARSLLYLLMLLPFTGKPQSISSTPGTNTTMFCDISTTWNGTTWSNGEPETGKDVIFSADYIFSAASFNACSLTVLDGAHITFTQNSNAIIVHDINVAQNGQLVFESGSNLIQTEAQQNTGNVIIKRNSSEIKKNAFTLWSSPVNSQLLLDFSPETLTNRFYTFNTTDNIYNTVTSPATTAFETAKGYLIRTGENHPETPAIWEGVFEGTPHTGNISFPLTFINEDDSYNAVGNPYPSPINITQFLDTNTAVITGTVWLWRKTDNTTQSTYSVVTKFGYQSNLLPEEGNTTIQNPFDLYEDGILNTAQGFLVKAKTAQSLVFDNSMRVPVSSQAFFRTADKKDGDTMDASRFWLNVTANQVFSQVLIGYTAEATTGYDDGLDGEAMMDGTTTLYSIVGNKKLAIQARPEFEITDCVALGFKTATAGTFTFALDHMDGLFAAGQHVYIKDNVTNTVHDLNSGSYTFTCAAGTFETRFTIIYDETMGTILPADPGKDVIVYSNNKQLKIQSTEEITAVTIYDITGKRIFAQENLSTTKFSSDAVNTSAPVIVRIALVNGAVVTKKTIVL